LRKVNGNICCRSTCEYITPISASYSITDEDGQVLVPDTIITPTEFSHLIVVDAASNTITEPQGYRQITVVFTDEKGVTHDIEKAYIIESVNSLIMGENSFKSMGSLIIAASNISGVETLHDSELSDVKVALRQAYSNISRLSVNIRKKNRDIILTTTDLSAADLLELKPNYLARLVQAQIVEANHLLGGNPMEERRQSGILSESVGEVSQFFRTKKPLTSPVCREALEILGILLAPSSKRLGRV